MTVSSQVYLMTMSFRYALGNLSNLVLQYASSYHMLKNAKMKKTCHGKTEGKQKYKICNKNQEDTNILDCIFTFVAFPGSLHRSSFYLIITKSNTVRGMPMGNRSLLRVVNFFIQSTALLITRQPI